MKTRSFIAVALLALMSLALVSFSDAQQVTESAVCTNALHEHETAVAIDPTNTDTLLIVWNDFSDTTTPGVQPGYAFSTNGGTSWMTPGIVPNVSDSFAFGFDPSVGIDRGHRSFYGYCGSLGGSSKGPVFVSETTNLGTGWTHHEVYGPYNPMPWNDKSYIAVDNTDGSYDGHIYGAWFDF